MDAKERTERMIRGIDVLVASAKVSTKRKRFVLDEFIGQLVGYHSVETTERRCFIADSWRLSEQVEYKRVLSDIIHQLEWSDVSVSERLLLHRAVKRARKNGWEGGESILDTLAQGRWFDAGQMLRVLLTVESFLEAFWQGENLVKHRLGLTLFDDPLTYARLYI